MRPSCLSQSGPHRAPRKSAPQAPYCNLTGRMQPNLVARSPGGLPTTSRHRRPEQSHLRFNDALRLARELRKLRQGARAHEAAIERPPLRERARARKHSENFTKPWRQARCTEAIRAPLPRWAGARRLATAPPPTRNPRAAIAPRPVTLSGGSKRRRKRRRGGGAAALMTHGCHSLLPHLSTWQRRHANTLASEHESCSCVPPAIRTSTMGRDAWTRFENKMTGKHSGRLC